MSCAHSAAPSLWCPMDILYKIFVDPFVQMGMAPDLLVQTLWEGFVAGVLVYYR